jgi:hypothetical protein
MSMLTLSLSLIAIAAGGYGDASDGYPDYSERLLHHWTNAVRVEPKAFKEDYIEGGCRWNQFSEDEQTPKPPLMWNHGLNEAARFHTEDMESNNWFEHESSDLTAFFDRVSRYYSGGVVGENIAWGYANEFEAVAMGWMCSTTGHRESLMSGDFNELGTGVVDLYYTQDFGGRNISSRLISMGIHSPQAPRGGVEFFADFYDEEGSPPDRFEVFLDGRGYDLELLYGAESQGVWTVEVATDTEDCHSYWFEAAVGGRSTTFPAEGVYGYGPCEFDNASAQWMGPGERQGCGCSAGGIPAAVALWPLSLLGLRRRGD